MSGMDILIEYFQKNGIERKVAEALITFFTKKIYPKGSIILNMGENTQSIHFIMSGIVRGFYLDEDGVEMTKCFSTKENWCCVYNMFRNEPSKYWIETLDDCVMAQIGVEQLRKIIDINIQFQELYMKLCTQAFIQSDERAINFQKMNAKERYLLFAKEHPDLVECVKQEYIASYIGITPTSLSRLKRNL